jgi:hypothetical protein
MIMKKPTIIAASAFQGFRGPDTSKEFQRFTRSLGPARRVPPGDRGVAVFMWLAPSHPRANGLIVTQPALFRFGKCAARPRIGDRALA